MSLKRRVFSKEFKEQVLLEIETGKSLAQAAREHEVNATLLAKWRSQRERYGERAFAGRGRAYTEEARVAALERKIGQLTMENDFLKKALATLDEIRNSGKSSGGGR